MAMNATHLAISSSVDKSVWLGSGEAFLHKRPLMARESPSSLTRSSKTKEMDGTWLDYTMVVGLIPLSIAHFDYACSTGLVQKCCQAWSSSGCSRLQESRVGRQLAQLRG